MRFIYVDDEKNAHKNLAHYLNDRAIVEQIDFFSKPQDAIAFAQQTQFDIAFLDIEMPGMNGFALARALKEIQPEIEVIYVTAYNQYHQEAYQTGGRAYLLKPFDEDDIDELFTFLSKLSSPRALHNHLLPPKPSVFIQTFGHFDLWVDGTPVIFKTAKAKELLALMINQRGSVVRSIDIFNCLWPNKTYSKTTATYVRKVVQALKKQLEDVGHPEIATFSRNAYFVNPQTFTCDYYTTAAGQADYLPTYNGYYMTQYPWAEESIYIIEQNIKSLSAKL